MKWQPIETAPKDGETILLYAEAWEDTWGIVTGQYADGEWHTSEGSVGNEDEDEFGSFAPTHWMPLPEPPESP